MKLLIHTIALNRADLLKQMIESIDTKHEYKLFVHIVSKDPEIREYFKLHPKDETNILEAGSPFGEGIFIKDYGFNIGVAECWNEALEIGYEPIPRYQHIVDVHPDLNIKSDRILFVNSDIKFGPGDIDRMIAFSEAKPDKLITITGSHGKHREKWDGMDLSHGFAVAILPPQIFDEIGYFDENFFPAYNEDCDYFTRLWLHRQLGPIQPGYDKISAKDSPLVECVKSGHCHHEGSCVIYSDSRLMELNRKTHGQNNRYYMAKWGGLNDHETYNWPFDEELDAGHMASLYIGPTQKHNPYPEFWNRLREKEKYYNEIRTLL
jgi:hypothetical protein